MGKLDDVVPESHSYNDRQGQVGYGMKRTLIMPGL